MVSGEYTLSFDDGEHRTDPLVDSILMAFPSLPPFGPGPESASPFPWLDRLSNLPHTLAPRPRLDVDPAALAGELSAAAALLAEGGLPPFYRFAPPGGGEPGCRFAERIGGKPSLLLGGIDRALCAVTVWKGAVRGHDLRGELTVACDGGLYVIRREEGAGPAAEALRELARFCAGGSGPCAALFTRG